MNVAELLQSGTGQLLWSPLVFGGLLALALLFVWMTFAPAPPERAVRDRLDGYVSREVVVPDDEMSKSLLARTLLPLFRRLVRMLGGLMPQRHVENVERMLLQAGEPGRISGIDFVGLRLLLTVVLGAGYFFVFGSTQPFFISLRNAAVLAFLGFMLPWMWLSGRVKARQHEIQRALPDALDMLTIGVEAGLAFESALVRVGDKWRNALTAEFRRAVAEMRVGTARDQALLRMAERCGVPDLETFVAVLAQSSQLGVSISLVLHAQAAQMREKRRQRAEELARQAGIKMVFPLVILIFPAMFVVILGPAVPQMMGFLSSMSGGK